MLILIKCNLPVCLSSSFFFPAWHVFLFLLFLLQCICLYLGFVFLFAIFRTKGWVRPWSQFMMSPVGHAMRMVWSLFSSSWLILLRGDRVSLSVTAFDFSHWWGCCPVYISFGNQSLTPPLWKMLGTPCGKWPPVHNLLTGWLAGWLICRLTLILDSFLPVSSCCLN